MTLSGTKIKPRIYPDYADLKKSQIRVYSR